MDCPSFPEILQAMDVLHRHVAFGKSSDDTTQGFLMMGREILMDSESHITHTKITFFSNA